MRKLIDEFVSREFLRFFVAGCLAAMVNFGVRIFLDQWLNYGLSIVLAYLAGMVVAFLLYQRKVFHALDIPLLQEVVRFILITALAILQTLLVSLLLTKQIFPMVGFVFYPEEIAHLAGMAVPMFTSFIGHKYFTFHR